MKVHFLNVGHGDMTLIEVAGKNILIDCNITEDNKALEKIFKVFPNKVIDIFILTHLHKDHMTGIQMLVDNGYKFEKIYESGFRYSSDNDKSKDDLYKSVVEFLEKNNVAKLKASENPFEKNDEKNFEMYCLNSCSEHQEDEDFSIHYNCLVIKITENGKSVLFTGDTNREVWENLITRNYSDLLKEDISILHASHHGSRTFFYSCGKNEEDEDAYTGHLEKITPEYTVISAKSNEEKREDWPPHEDAIKLYKKYTEKSVEETSEEDVLVFEINKYCCNIHESSSKMMLNGDRDINKQNFRISSYVNNPIKLFDVPYRKMPLWPIGNHYSANINAAFKAKEPSVLISYRNNGNPLPKNGKIYFTVSTNTPAPYEVKWQILNTGEEAAADGEEQLRGDFYASEQSNPNMREEHTKYRGSHMAQAYIIKDGVCVAKSEEFVVNIR